MHRVSALNSKLFGKAKLAQIPGLPMGNRVVATHEIETKSLTRNSDSYLTNTRTNPLRNIFVSSK